MGSALGAVLLVAVSAALGAGGAFVMARVSGARRLLGVVPGLVALAALLVLETTNHITGHQLTTSSVALVLASAAVTLLVRRPPPS
jgi:hypothetical protein